MKGLYRGFKMKRLYTIAPCKIDKKMQLFFINTLDNRVILNKYTGQTCNYQFRVKGGLKRSYAEICKNNIPLHLNIAPDYGNAEHYETSFPLWKRVATSSDYMFVDPRVKKIIDNLKS